MDNPYFFRILRLKDVEIFHLKERRFGKSIGYLGLIDFNRPATLNDYPYLKKIEKEEEFGSYNFIKALFISNTVISNELQEYLVELSDSFIGDKEDCFWNLDFLQIQNLSANLLPLDILKIYLETLDNQYNFKIEAPSITPEKFNHLSQN